MNTFNVKNHKGEYHFKYFDIILSNRLLHLSCYRYYDADKYRIFISFNNYNKLIVEISNHKIFERQ